MLAGMIAVALVLSFFHGIAFDGDDMSASASIVQITGNDCGSDPRQVPAHPAPHKADHCLTHVSSVATQDIAVIIRHAAHSYRIVSMRSPESAEMISPFKPPRA